MLVAAEAGKNAAWGPERLAADLERRVAEARKRVADAARAAAMR